MMDPANLDPLPPGDLARRYVDAMGGGGAILAKAKRLCRGRLSLGANCCGQLVFADPANAAARELQASL